MDTIQHMAWSIPISLGSKEMFNMNTTETIILGSLLAFFGGLPDFIGFIEKVYARLKGDPDYKNKWNWYLWAHNNYPWMFIWIPTYTLHIWMDSFVHENNRWWVPNEGLKYEIGSWLLLLLSIIPFYHF